MGNFWSHSNSTENQDNQTALHYYYYPPKHGRYFGSTFVMGNDKFEMSQPESYLFGENYDLNYLGGKPSPFPYKAPFTNEPMQMLKSLINIRKETVKLINPENDLESNYTIEFIFDSDVDCAITIYFLCKEDISPQGVKYIPNDFAHRSETFHYKAGIGQMFSQSSPIFNPQNYDICDLLYNILDDKGEFNSSALYPVVVSCVAEEGDDPRQSHSLIAIIEKVYDQIFSLKPIKQKIFVDGLTYLLQEIYGIENKVDKIEKNGEDENDKSFECVICMSDLRDTLILPCRHFCACYNCSESLRFQTNNCPICRVPFRALLQIKAVQRVSSNATNANSQQPIILSDSLNDVMLDIPPGYETIPLVEALNGLTHPQSNSLTNRIILEDDDDEQFQQKTSTKNVEKKVNSNIILTEKHKEKKFGDDSNKDFDKESINSNFNKVTGLEDSASASSSSLSGGNNQENIQEKQALLLSSKQKNQKKPKKDKTQSYNSSQTCNQTAKNLDI